MIHFIFWSSSRPVLFIIRYLTETFILCKYGLNKPMNTASMFTEIWTPNLRTHAPHRIAELHSTAVIQIAFIRTCKRSCIPHTHTRNISTGHSGRAVGSSFAFGLVRRTAIMSEGYRGFPRSLKENTVKISQNIHCYVLISFIIHNYVVENVVKYTNNQSIDVL